MALHIQLYNLPPTEEQLSVYQEKARTTWIPNILKQPGLKKFRAYRNPMRVSPHVMAHTEFDSLASLMHWIQSEDYQALMSDLVAVGVTHQSVQVWEDSPLVPESLKP